jgi:hypothetical protein
VFEELEDLAALSAATGGRMHVCHLESSDGRDVAIRGELLEGVQASGLPIPVETEPEVAKTHRTTDTERTTPLIRAISSHDGLRRAFRGRSGP